MCAYSDGKGVRRGRRDEKGKGEERGREWRGKWNTNMEQEMKSKREERKYGISEIVYTHHLHVHVHVHVVYVV